MQSTVQFTLPKKTDTNSYSCQLFIPENERRRVFKYDFKQVQVVGFASRDTIILLKNQDLHNFMFSLNQHIINTVKNNYKTWFASQMDPELVDDYFSTTLTYDKAHGNVVKLQLRDSVSEDIKKYVGTKCKITINFNKLKFFKQKFFLECTIGSIGTNPCEIKEEECDVGFGSDDEIPEPSIEDLENMRKTCLAKLTQTLEVLKSSVKMTELRIKSAKRAKNSSEIISIMDKHDI